MIGREASKNQSVTNCNRLGNSAAMRDALLKVKELFDGRIMFQQAIREAHEAVNAALATPPRNCDRLSADKCKQILKMEMDVYIPQEVTENDREIAQRTAYGVIDALFAPYTEQKGETNGSK